MIETLKYTLKIWVTTALISPVILFAIDYISCTPSSFERFEDILAIYPIAVFDGLLFSCFTWMVFFVFVYNLQKIYLPQKLYKPMIQFTGLFLAFLTFVVLFTLHDSGFSIIDTEFFWVIVTPYLLCLFLGIQLYKLPQLYIHHHETETL